MRPRLQDMAVLAVADYLTPIYGQCGIARGDLSGPLASYVIRNRHHSNTSKRIEPGIETAL